MKTFYLLVYMNGRVSENKKINCILIENEIFYGIFFLIVNIIHCFYF